MDRKIKRVLLIATLIFSFGTTHAQKHIIFLHNKYLETHSIEDIHPKYGRVELDLVKNKFEKAGFIVIANKRNGTLSMDSITHSISNQVDSIINTGVSAKEITIVGTSKGGYIAQFVSSHLKNEDLNYVFIGCYQDADILDFPNVHFCGNILTIYEKSDPYGVSAQKKKEASSLKVPNFKEIELNTGLNHGFLYKAMDEWILPSIQWANRIYK